MAWVETLQEAINYMEAHLLEDINYEDVAKHVNMSGFEFHRAFSYLSGITANNYIRNRRLSLAGQELVNSDEKVIDIALKYGYDTPESFCKAFTRFHGVSPRAVQKRGTALCLFNPLNITIKMEGGQSMEYRIEEVKEQKFLTYAKLFPSQGENKVPEFWGESRNQVESIRNFRPNGKHDLFGLCTSDQVEDGKYRYGIGVLVDEETEKFDEGAFEKKGYYMWTAKAGTYVVLKCFGDDERCIKDMWERFYKEFLPQTGYSFKGGTDYEVYYENGEPNLFCEIWIPVQK